MRELKFRLIRDVKIVGYEVHEYDKITNTFYIFHNKDTTPGYNICAVEKAFIPHDNKEQCTSIKDKNGKEIYEGDIVLLKSLYETDEPIEAKCVISHSEGSYRRLTEKICKGIGNWIVEKIGNIHENPELILDNN